MYETAKKWGVIIGLIGGIMSFTTIVTTFAQVVRYWDQFVYMTEIVNVDDVTYYHKTLRPRVEKLWELEAAEH